MNSLLKRYIWQGLEGSRVQELQFLWCLGYTTLLAHGCIHQAGSSEEFFTDIPLLRHDSLNHWLLVINLIPSLIPLSGRLGWA